MSPFGIVVTLIFKRGARRKLAAKYGDQDQKLEEGTASDFGSDKRAQPKASLLDMENSDHKVDMAKSNASESINESTENSTAKRLADQEEHIRRLEKEFRQLQGFLKEYYLDMDLVNPEVSKNDGPQKKRFWDKLRGDSSKPLDKSS